MADFDKGISIIIPVYNAEKYIHKCMESLFAQTFKKNLEYIFVLDKNSTDSSEKILDNETKNIPNVKILKPKDNSGAGYNRNTAIEHVSKDYIGFCDADDWLDSDFFERLYDYSQIYNADIAVGCTSVVDEQTQAEFSKEEFPFSIEYTPGKVFQKLKWNTVWDKIYRTKLIKENKEIRFAENIMHEDNIFLINAVYKANKIITVPGSYYYWRKYPESVSMISTESEKYRNDAYIAFNEILDSLENMDIPAIEKICIIKQIMPWAVEGFKTSETAHEYLKDRIQKIVGTHFAY